MRNGQNKHHRMRGRNRSGGGGGGKSHNPLTRVYESNGPDVKIRGTANHIAEKYIQLARDAQTSGDPVAAENYYQHAEHYFRLIAAAQEQFRQNTPFQNRPEGGDNRGGDESFDDSDETVQPMQGGAEPYSPQMQQQPYPPRDQQFHQPRQQHNQPNYPRGDSQPRYDNRPQQTTNEGNGDIDRLPSFITGGQQPQAAGQNGHDHQSGDRFPLHRRRRRRGPYQEGQGGQKADEGDGSGPQPASE
jgi:hypothetical protein